MKHMTSVLLAASLLLLAAPVQAKDQDQGGTNKRYSLQATITNRPSGGAVFNLEGVAKGFPKGTLLHITLCVRSNSPTPIEADFFRVKVIDGRFKARKVYPTKTFATLKYWAQADLILSTQRKAVRDWIRRELGLPKEARLVLAKRNIFVGTNAQQAEFRRQTLIDLKQYTDVFIKDCGAALKLVEKAMADRADGKAELKKTRKKLEGSSTSLHTWLAKYVVWHEELLIKGLKNASAEMFWALKKYKKGKQSRARRSLKQVAQMLKSLREKIDSRLPKREGDEKKDDKKEEGDSSPAREKK